MTPTYSEYQTNDTLRYLQGLFNVKKFIHENKKASDQAIPFAQSYAMFQAKVDSVLNRNQYNKIDLRGIFSFMYKN